MTIVSSAVCPGQRTQLGTCICLLGASPTAVLPVRRISQCRSACRQASYPWLPSGRNYADGACGRQNAHGSPKTAARDGRRLAAQVAEMPEPPRIGVLAGRAMEELREVRCFAERERSGDRLDCGVRVDKEATCFTAVQVGPVEPEVHHEQLQRAPERPIAAGLRSRQPILVEGHVDQLKAARVILRGEVEPAGSRVTGAKSTSWRPSPPVQRRTT